MRTRAAVLLVLLALAPLALAQTLQFGAPRFAVDEFVGPGVLTVVRMGGSAGAASVTYTATNGTATSPADFTAVSGMVSFADGETAKTFTIPVSDDAVWEDAESINVVLSNPQGASLGANSSTKLWIHPSDSPMTMHGDFNGDGTFEILWRNRQSGDTVFWYLDGTGRNVVGSGPLISVDPAFTIAGVAQMDADPFADIIWYNPTAGVTDIWIMESGFLKRHATYESMAYPWQIVSTRDVNFDDNPDITWRNVETGVMFSWIMNGETVVSGTAARQTNPSVRIADEVCYDGNAGYYQARCAEPVPGSNYGSLAGREIHTMGYPWDIVALEMYYVKVWWRNSASGRLFGWRDYDGNSGTAALDVDPAFRLAAVGPLAGFGPGSDLVWYNPDGGVTDIWIMQSETTMGSHGTYYTFGRPWDIIAPRRATPLTRD
jgi:hypothetical protein